ncbi:MAG: carbon-nitrogen hydrolase family protein [Clostridiales bacterium]|nr:carbon-nitrogen hydrolase family protein [Clostridiales bacterium]
MKKMNIAQIQMPVADSKDATIEYIKSAIASAAEKADFAALPEMFCCPYHVDNFPKYAEEDRGRMWQACSALAKEYGIYLSAGTMPERGEDGKIYNTAYVFDREGRQIAKHRKMHLFDIDVKGEMQFKESDTLTAGNEVTVFDTEFGKFGICICYDFRFPELARLMALKGAQVIFVSAAFNMTTGPAHWELMFRSQAVNNQVYAIGTAPSRDENASYKSWGHSIITDPWGTVVSQMDEKEGICINEIDLDHVGSIREQLPLLKQRRTDIYKLVEL